MSDAELIRSLGGAAAVARMCGLKTTTVQEWIGRNSIPRKHQARLFEACEQHGKPLHPSDFFEERWTDGTTEWQRQRTGRTARPAPQGGRRKTA